MITLWTAILDFAEARGGVDGEGNSGAFFNAKDAAKTEKYYYNSLKTLRLEFQKVTGFLPVWVEHSGEYKAGNGHMMTSAGWDGHWTFELKI